MGEGCGRECEGRLSEAGEGRGAHQRVRRLRDGKVVAGVGASGFSPFTSESILGLIGRGIEGSGVICADIGYPGISLTSSRSIHGGYSPLSPPTLLPLTSPICHTASASPPGLSSSYASFPSIGVVEVTLQPMHPRLGA